MSNRPNLRKNAKRPSRTVPILLDGEVREQIEAVENELDRLDRAPAVKDRRMSTKSDDAQREKLIAELDHLYASAEESTIYVALEALQRTAYRALVDNHPPRKDEAGKVHPADAFGANMETLPIPLVRACIVGRKASDDVADTKVEPFPPDLVHGVTGALEPNTDDVTLGWLLGFTYKDASGVDVTVDPFLTDRQVEKLYSAAFSLNRGDDAVPLRRPR